MKIALKTYYFLFDVPFFDILQSNPHDNTIKFVSVAVYFVGIVNQILLNCYFGNHLSYESDGITSIIYQSQWMDRNEKCKRAMRILVERSMRPMAIWAGGLFELSLPTFVRVSQ